MTIYSRQNLLDNRLKYTHEEIQEYNAKAYDKIGTGMQLIHDSDKWIPPNIPGRKFRPKGSQ